MDKLWVLAAVMLLAAAPTRDGATIVDSGSTNTMGYRIDVWSDGSGTLTLQNRMGTAQAGPKPFSIAAATVTEFFADLKAARSGGARSQPCMKSASFGTRTYVNWHGWSSPDLDCPPGNALGAALVRDVGAIRAASGIDAIPLHRGILFGPGRGPGDAPSANPSPNL